VITAIFRDAWGGVLRVKAEGRSASLWFVKGQLAHGVLTQGKERSEGIVAVESAAGWKNGTFMLEAGALPPARTIRLAMEDILRFLAELTGQTEDHVAEEAASSNDNLESLLQDLRVRVPGLESISVLNGALVEATTAQDLTERGWLSDQLRTYCDDDTAKPEKLFLQQGEHSLLILKRGQLATVLSARTGTAPEALFWAGEEARKRVSAVDDTDDMKG
jgi:hypothetical protein